MTVVKKTFTPCRIEVEKINDDIYQVTFTKNKKQVAAVVTEEEAKEVAELLNLIIINS